MKAYTSPMLIEGGRFVAKTLGTASGPELNGVIAPVGSVGFGL